MTAKLHTITQYHYKFDCRSGLPYVQLWSQTGSAEVQFVSDDAELPALMFQPDLTKATLYFRLKQFSMIIDLLRNESPVNLIINDQPPGFVFLCTGGWEPVGEAEGHGDPN